MIKWILIGYLFVWGFTHALSITQLEKDIEILKTALQVKGEK